MCNKLFIGWFVCVHGWLSTHERVHADEPNTKQHFIITVLHCLPVWVLWSSPPLINRSCPFTVCFSIIITVLAYPAGTVGGGAVGPVAIGPWLICGPELYVVCGPGLGCGPTIINDDQMHKCNCLFRATFSI